MTERMLIGPRWNRRHVFRAGGALALATTRFAGSPLGAAASLQDGASKLVVDLANEPAKLDPATTYDADGWSIVHSIYDSLLQYGPEGQIEPLLAESFTMVDPHTHRVVLRSGITFHNGEPLTAAAVAFSVAHILDEATGSQVAGNFSVISEVVEVDERTIDLRLSAPAPWLPAQIAAWLAILPPEYAAANDFLANPVGTGPYRFESLTAGDRISLVANDAYFETSPKGQPVAAAVDYRFVPDASTRVADLLAGTADMVRGVPVDQIGAVEDGGATVLQVPVAGCAFIRIPTDVEPFDDVRVRQAMNYAVDVDTIIAALLAGSGQRLANLFVPNGLGFDPGLAPYAYDPNKARELLAEAGYPDGFDTAIDLAAAERSDLVEAIAGQLTEVGIRTTVNRMDLALFNSGDWWLGKDPDAAPLRFVTWRPLFDPYTLLSLLVSNTGFLSRHDNPEIQALFDQFATEADTEARAEIARQLGLALHEQPAALYLYSLTSSVGVAAGVPEWTPRADEYLIATLRTQS